MAISDKGKGKSGGARVITYTVEVDEASGTVTLLTIYDKGERESITSREIGLLLAEAGQSAAAWRQWLYAAAPPAGQEASFCAAEQAVRHAVTARLGTQNGPYCQLPGCQWIKNTEKQPWRRLAKA